MDLPSALSLDLGQESADQVSFPQLRIGYSHYSCAIEKQSMNMSDLVNVIQSVNVS